jgi:glycerophosphoryl diester phosphodiesterase
MEMKLNCFGLKRIVLFLFIALSALLCDCFLSVKSAAEGKETRERTLINDILIIAHRGASDISPEETLNAFDEAIRVKASYIEFDLQETKDHKLVAMHDNTVDRTTNGKGKIRSYTLHQLKQLDAGYPFYHMKTPIRIATLDEIFGKYKNETNYYIETKNSSKSNKGQEKQIVHLMEKYHIKADKVILESFHLDSLKTMHEINPKIKLVQLFSVPSSKALSRIHLDEISKIGYGIGINYHCIHPAFVTKVRQKNLKIHVYTVDNKTEMSKLIEMKVNGIFTGNPELLKNLLLN